VQAKTVAECEPTGSAQKIHNGDLTILGLLYLTPTPSLSRVPNPTPTGYTWQSITLRGHMSKHNRRTSDNKLRNRDWRTASSILIMHRRHSLSSIRKKY
jgi:hypothetical protein